MKLFFAVALFSFHIWAAETQPFIYLNQYFTYEYVNNSSFKIDTATYVFDNLTVVKTENGIEVTIKDTSLFATNSKTTGAQVEIFGQKNKLLKSSPVTASNKGYFEKFEIDLKGVLAVCLVAKNEFTVKKMCKKNIEISGQNTRTLTFSANGINLNPVGQIILNDKKNALNFRAENQDYFFEITTNYKNIVINRASKMEKASLVHVDFVELNQPNKYNFKKKIRLSDTSFEIAIDDLVKFHQDIAFPNADLITQSVDYEFKNWKIRQYNKFGLEPVILYSQLSIQSTDLNAKILTDLSKGVRIYNTTYPSNNLEYYYAGKLIQLQLLNDVNNNTVNNKNLTLITLEGGAKYYISSDFHYDLNLTLQELIYAEYQPSTNSIDTVKGLTPVGTLSASSILAEFAKFRFQASGGLGLIAPTSLPSGQTQFAFSLVLGSQVSYKLRSGRLYYGFDYLIYNASNSTYKYNRQSIEHKIGFYYLY